MNDRTPRSGPGRNNNQTSSSSSKRSGPKKRGRSRGRSRSKKIDLVKYWGDPKSLPEAEGYQTSTPDPSVVINSLGRPPIPGHENASKHYFNLAYERATNLAVALAAAGGLDAPIDVQQDHANEPEVLDMSSRPNNKTEYQEGT